MKTISKGVLYNEIFSPKTSMAYNSIQQKVIRDGKAGREGARSYKVTFTLGYLDTGLRIKIKLNEHNKMILKQWFVCFPYLKLRILLGNIVAVITIIHQTLYVFLREPL